MTMLTVVTHPAPICFSIGIHVSIEPQSASKPPNQAIEAVICMPGEGI